MNLKPLLGGALAMALWASSASAAWIYVDLKTPDSSNTGIGNVLSYDLGNGLTMSVTSWSTTGNNGTLAAARTSIYGGGLGVCNSGEVANGCNSPNHAMDNSGYNDFLLFTFNMTVDPIKVKIGWSNGDSDMNYWVGSEANPNMAGLALANLGTEGFGPQYNSDGSGARWFDVDGGSGLSLLLAAELVQDPPEAYACGYRGRYTCYRDTDWKDYVKIEAIKVDYTEPPPQENLPEPATYGLVGSALVGLAYLRRKRA